MKIIHLFVISLISLSPLAGAFAPPLAYAGAAKTQDAKAGRKAAAKAEPRQKMLGAESFTLSNGMQVVLVRNTRAPVITQMIWYAVGAADEQSGKTGLAHFLEHLMFKGSDNVPSGELSKRVRALGGNDNAFTTQDYTAYYQSIAVQHLETVMQMESDRMKSILIPAEEFEAERQVVLEERRQRTENDPRAHLYEQMRYALFPGHPYAAPVIGWEQDIKSLTRQDALDWHKKWYNPANAILVVSGDVTVSELKALAEKTYGTIPALQIEKTILPPINNFPAQTVMTLRDPRVHQPQWVRLYRVPGMIGNKAESLAMDVAQEILSGNPSTRLYKSLVVEQKLATGASLGYSGSVRGLGTLSVGISPAESVSLKMVEDAYLAEIEKIIASGITETELSEAKKRLQDSVAFARDSLSGPARILGEALTIGATLDDVEYWAYDIQSVTAQQVKDVIQKYIAGNNAYVTGYIEVDKPESAAKTEKQ
jgi:zinc protease